MRQEIIGFPLCNSKIEREKGETHALVETRNNHSVINEYNFMYCVG